MIYRLWRYDIRLTLYDIFALGKYDIISVPSYAEGIYHPPEVGIISKIYHLFRKGTDIIEKSHLCPRTKVTFFCGVSNGVRTHDLQGHNLAL